MSTEKPMNILVVDDEDIVHQTLAPYLRDCGHETESAHNGKDALKMIAAKDFDLALVDVKMPGMDGLELLVRAIEARPELPVVLITGHGNMDMAIKALRRGAADFLTKPVKLAELDAVIERSIRIRDLMKIKRRLLDTISGIQAQGDARVRGRRMVAESGAMKEVRNRIRLAVEADCETILIIGETGTGKEVVAREIHFMSGDHNPFIAVSCPAIPESLVESELFGHVKGSFTGAVCDKAGCFELADGGTLFLDEVADLSFAAQAKLLRVLETRCVRRIGGAGENEVNVKVIAATNSPLEEMVKNNRFRQDLYYRLNVFCIEIPPLREREEDILPLAEHFLKSLTTRKHLPVTGFSEQAQEMLLDYDFPGNARELKNIIERSAIICREALIEPQHLSLSTSGADENRRASGIESREDDAGGKEAIIKALQEARFNRRLAAEILGMPYSTLRYKIKKYDIA